MDQTIAVIVDRQRSIVTIRIMHMEAGAMALNVITKVQPVMPIVY